MKKFTVLKLIFALLLVCASLTVRPAHALNCIAVVQGCPFLEVRPVGEGVCCWYRCWDGREFSGLCQWPE